MYKNINIYSEMNFNSMSTIVDFCNIIPKLRGKSKPLIDSAAAGYIIKPLNQRLNSRFNG